MSDCVSRSVSHISVLGVSDLKSLETRVAYSQMDEALDGIAFLLYPVCINTPHYPSLLQYDDNQKC